MSFQNRKYVTNTNNEHPNINTLILHKSIKNILAAIFWVVTQCVPVRGYQSAEEIHGLLLQLQSWKWSFSASSPTYPTTRRHNTVDHNTNLYSCENLTFLYFTHIIAYGLWLVVCVCYTWPDYVLLLCPMFGVERQVTSTWIGLYFSPTRGFPLNFNGHLSYFSSYSSFWNRFHLPIFG